MSKAIGVGIDHDHKDADYRKVADGILGNSKYDNSNILICWHHEEILNLAAALGVVPADLPASANWPKEKWPGGVYGWVLQICYDGDGKVIPSQTFCMSEKLMYDDYGQNPPNG